MRRSGTPEKLSTSEVGADMAHDDRRLLRHLVIAVLLKLALLVALWWAFVRESRVDIDADRAAARIGAPAAPQE